MKQSKTVLKELTAAYRAVLRHGILCNAIALGLIATPAMAGQVIGFLQNDFNDVLTVSGQSADYYGFYAGGGVAATVAKGSSFSNNETNYGGAGLWMHTKDTEKTISVNGANFDGNNASYMGGAIGIQSGHLVVNDSVFTGNTAAEGGAIESFTVDKNTNAHNYVEINNSTFRENEALAFGAVALFGQAGVNTVTGSHFIKNKATDTGGSPFVADGVGGGLFVGSDAKLKVVNTEFKENSAVNWGGALATRSPNQNQEDSGLEIENSTFTGNTAGDLGGAIYADIFKNTRGDGAASIKTSTFSTNSAAKGGAVYIDKQDSSGNVATLDISGSTFTGNTASENGGAIYNNGTLSLSGTNSFSGNTAAGQANDIYNLGALTIAGGTTTMDGGISGTGSLVVDEGATLNIGTAAITQDSITLNGTLVADLVADADSILNATTKFDGNGKLSLAIEKAGTYNLFGGEIFAKAKEQIVSTVYDLDWTTNDGKSVVATVKSADKIAQETGVSAESATAVSRVAESESKQLQDLSVKLQEKLAAGDTDAVEHATKAVHPETESVVQSVSTSVQHTVVHLASARMVAPTVGRAGGDVQLTSGGVWAQGLFNKSKQANAFNGYTRGIAAGLDGTFNKVWTIGAGYAFAHSDLSGSARDTEIDSNTVFVYGQYKPSQWYLNAIANYTWSDYSENGTVIENTPITADYKVQAFGGNIATGYDFKNGITPELGLRYIHISADDYTNSFGVTNHMDDANFLTGILGAKYMFNVMATKHLTFAPQLNAGVKYDLLSDDYLATVAMPGVDAYALEGSRLNRMGGEFGIGLGMQYRGVQMSLNYDIDVRKDYTSQTGMLKFRYNF